MPKRRTLPFETQIIERYRRRRSSVEEALIEMYLAGVSVRRVEDITEALRGTKVSPSTVSELNQKLAARIEEWRKRPVLRGCPAGCRNHAFRLLDMEAGRSRVVRPGHLRCRSGGGAGRPCPTWAAHGGSRRWLSGRSLARPHDGRVAATRRLGWSSIGRAAFAQQSGTVGIEAHALAQGMDGQLSPWTPASIKPGQVPT